VIPAERRHPPPSGDGHALHDRSDRPTTCR
jgi:hypothetical protein